MGRKLNEQDEGLNPQKVQDLIYEEYLRDPDQSYIRRIIEEGGDLKTKFQEFPNKQIVK